MDEEANIEIDAVNRSSYRIFKPGNKVETISVSGATLDCDVRDGHLVILIGGTVDRTYHPANWLSVNRKPENIQDVRSLVPQQVVDACFGSGPFVHAFHNDRTIEVDAVL